MFNNSGIAQRYSNRVRIGNWSEDFELERLRMQDFLLRKSRGELTVTKFQARISKTMEPVPLTPSADGNVHFGDAILLYSVQTTGVLSVEMGEKTQGHRESYPVSTSTLVKGPVARNVFIIEPADKTAKLGDCLVFGQQFRLRTNDSLHGQPLYLASQPSSPFSYSKVSRKNEVFVSAECTYDTVFHCEFKDLSYRMEMEGAPVPGNMELCVMHNNTRKCLNSQEPMGTEYGQEFEVCGNTVFSCERPHIMYAQAKGVITSETAVRAEMPQNHWAFLNGAAESEQSQQDA